MSCTWQPGCLPPKQDSGLQMTKAEVHPCCILRSLLASGTPHTCDVIACELTVFSYLKPRLLRGSNQLSSRLAACVVSHFPFPISWAVCLRCERKLSCKELKRMRPFYLPWPLSSGGLLEFRFSVSPGLPRISLKCHSGGWPEWKCSRGG